MPHHQWLDRWPAWALVVGTLLLLALASEVGFRAARLRPGDDAAKKDHSHVLLGGLLALLGLLLAFSFGMVEERFRERKQLVLDEANAIGTTFLRAKLLPSPHDQRVRELLIRYVDLRVPNSPAELHDALVRSQQVHEALWTEAREAAAKAPTPVVALFVSSLNSVIDLHESRVTVNLFYRLPSVILTILYLVSLLSMGVLGYSAGLARTRPIPATVAVLVAVTLVIVMVIELDRPWARVFHVSQHAFRDVRDTMR